MRLYYMVDLKDQVSKSQLCDLWCQHQHLDLCDVTNLPQPYENLSSLQPIGEHQIRSIYRVGVEQGKLTLDWSFKNFKDFLFALTTILSAHLNRNAAFIFLQFYSNTRNGAVAQLVERLSKGPRLVQLY